MSSEKRVEDKIHVTWTGWVSLVILLVMVSGVFSKSAGPLAALDFTNLTGNFGKIAEGLTFLGADGTGAKDGFLQALNIAPVVILFCGIIDVAQEYGALDAATILFQPILKVIMGIPGTAGLAFVGSFTSVDVGSVMTKDLFDEGKITDDERTIFVAYQNAGSAIITNLLTTGAPLMAIIPFSFATIFGVCMLCKLLGANVMRLILMAKRTQRKEVQV